MWSSWLGIDENQNRSDADDECPLKMAPHYYYLYLFEFVFVFEKQCGGRPESSKLSAPKFHTHFRKASDERKAGQNEFNIIYWSHFNFMLNILVQEFYHGFNSSPIPLPI